MEDLTSTKHIDRLPVLISGAGEDLLGILKLPSGTAEAQATAVIMSFEEWGIMDRVAALWFDITAANTALPKARCNFTDNETCISGACAIIEQRLGRDLLFLACHNHVVGATFKGTVVHLLALKFFYVSE